MYIVLKNKARPATDGSTVESLVMFALQYQDILNFIMMATI